MGLDMYLSAEKYERYGEGQKLDGMPLLKSIYEVGYWRKHPDLHGYIVKTYANGVDECQRIDLMLTDVVDIINRLRDSEPLEKTSGFFFGSSDGSAEEREEEAVVFEKALAWAEKHDATLFYRASW
jgi:hypothetical protein